jgi:tRNA threonylcarbamoyladenosine biosynthesis protein TsaB
MALLLAFDTATPHCAVALCEDDHLLAQREHTNKERPDHAERLNVWVNEIMVEAGKNLAQLQAVAVGVGPGSYTGLRIGLSAAKGLVFGLEVPLITMDTQQVMVLQLLHSGAQLNGMHLHAMVDARRMEAYVRTYGSDMQAMTDSAAVVLDDEWVKGLSAHTHHMVFGDGADKASELWQRHPHVYHIPGIRPGCTGLVHAAWSGYSRERFADVAYAVPTYVKEARAVLPARPAWAQER